MKTVSRASWSICRLQVLFVLLFGLTLGPEPVAGQRITHGPVLGRLGSTEIGVWARTDQPADFHVRYGTDPDDLRQTSALATTTLEHDNTGWVMIRDLHPGSTYYYEVVSNVPSELPPSELSGSFRTLPSAEQFRDPEHNPDGLFNFSFEIATGNTQPRNPEPPVFKTMLENHGDRIHFAIMNGDFIYELGRGHTVDEWLQEVRQPRDQVPRIVEIAPNIVGVWENYKQYYERGKRLSAFLRRIPTFFIFDDHDILNDMMGAGEVGLRDPLAVFRDVGVQAWYDYVGWSNPVEHTQPIHFGRARLSAGSDVLVDSDADFRNLDLQQAATLHVHWGGPPRATCEFWVQCPQNPRLGEADPGNPNAGVYEAVEILDRNRLRISPPADESGTSSYSIGRRSYYSKQVSNAEIFVVDTRSHRRLHDRNLPFDPSFTMLGDQQKDWLKQEMRESSADFLFVVSTVNLMISHVQARNPEANKDESWAAVAAEREEMIEFWDSLGKPVFVLTGDLHNSFAIKVTDRIWEFASGPLTSPNHTLASEANRPITGRFESQGREADMRWSTFFIDDGPAGRSGTIPPPLGQPVYSVIQVNNVFPNRGLEAEDDVWVAYPRPQVIFQYYDGRNGHLLYAEAIPATR